MKTILHTCDIGSGEFEEVFRALATEDGLAGWWTTKVSADVRVGGVIDFTFGATFNPDMEITKLDPAGFVKWKCLGGHDPWLGNTFEFRLERREHGTTLFFRQEYAQELNDEEYGRYNYNWGYYLESLRLLVETGRGKPYLAETLEQKKQVVEQFVIEYKNKHNPDIVDELVAEDCRIHIPLPGIRQGREGLRANGKMICGAFPDVAVEREFFAAEGDIVVERAHARATHQGELMGTAATNKPVTWSELHAYRVEGGQITEVWSEADFMGILAQLGMVDLPAA